MPDELLMNDGYVVSLRIAIRDGASGLGGVPTFIKRIIERDAWQERTIQQTGEVVRFERFAEFVADRPLAGLGTDLDTIKRMCRDDMAAVDLIDRVTANPKHHHLPDSNNVTITQRGNRADAALRRLRKDRPDLHAQVLQGDITPHAAMIAAGFRTKTMTVPADPDRALQALITKFGAEQVRAVVDRILNT